MTKQNGTDHKKRIGGTRIKSSAVIAAICLGVAVPLWVLSPIGSGEASFPVIDDPAPETVAGVVFIDDGDGELGPGDKPVVGAEVRLGTESQWFQRETAEWVTGEDGSFVLTTPPGVNTPLFVEARIPVDSPAGSDAPTWASFRVDATAGNLTTLVPLDGIPHRCAEEADCGKPLLPDLVPVLDGVDTLPDHPMSPESVRVDTTTQPGRRLLRFASVAANMGDGPAHVLGSGETPLWGLQSSG